MAAMITLRPVVSDDSELLHAWRNDPATRAASHNTALVTTDEHKHWLSKQLANPNLVFCIAEHNEIPAGTVRAEHCDDVWELSWTVAPDARGKGIAKAMVATMAQMLSGALRAEIRAGNPASIKVAEYAGLSLLHETDDILHYGRDALSE